MASLPSGEELSPRCWGGLKSPIAGLVYVLHGTLASLVYVLEAIEAKGRASARAQLRLTEGYPCPKSRSLKRFKQMSVSGAGRTGQGPGGGVRRTAAAPVAVAAAAPAGGAAARRRPRRRRLLRRDPGQRRRQEDPGDQGGPRADGARPQGGEGPGGQRSQAAQGGRLQGSRRRRSRPRSKRPAAPSRSSRAGDRHRGGRSRIVPSCSLGVPRACLTPVKACDMIPRC